MAHEKMYAICEDKCKKELREVLFTGTANVDNTVEFDAGEYEVFAITLHMAVNDAVIICGKGIDSLGTTHIDGMNAVHNANNGTIYFRVSLTSVGAAIDKFKVVVAGWSNTLPFTDSNKSNCYIKKIVGLV